MSDVRAAWNEAGDRLTGLGLKLKLHYEQRRSEGAPVVPSPDQETTQRAAKEAVQRLLGTVQDTFEALSAAAQDDAVRADVREAGRSVAAALEASLSEVSEDLRGRRGPKS